jgi:hypothetical protein
MISVTAKAGAAMPNATVAAADCTSLNMNFADKNRSQSAAHQTALIIRTIAETARRIYSGPRAIDRHLRLGTIAISRLYCKIALNLFRRRQTAS